MERWYAGFSVYGRPSAVLEQISTVVRRHNLLHWVPRVCWEKKPGSKFYLFIAIDSETKGVPPEEISPLLELPLLRTRIGPPGLPIRFNAFDRSELQGFVTSDVGVHNFAPALRRAMLHERRQQDPFAEPPAHEAPVGDESDARWERLLFWISASGQGSVDGLRSAGLAMGLDPAGAQTGRLLRRLRLLGHVELAASGRRWSVTPAALAALGDQPGEWVLCGARDARLLERLSEISVPRQRFQSGLAPPAVIFSGGSDLPDRLLAHAPELSWAGPAALRLAEALPTLDEWASTLPALEGIHAPMFEVRRFDGTTFQPAVFTGESGFYELWPEGAEESGAVAPRYTLYYDASRRAWLRGEWYGLRFLADSEARAQPFAYEPAKHRAAFSGDRRPPEIFERALVLSSGCLPRASNGWLVYDGISPRVAEVLLERLSSA